MVYKEHYHAGKSGKDMERQMKHTGKPNASGLTGSGAIAEFVWR